MICCGASSMNDLVPPIDPGFVVVEDRPKHRANGRSDALNRQGRPNASKSEAKGNTSRFKLIPFEQLRPGPEATYLIKGLIPRVGLTVVWGPPKCGKSFWLMDALLHVALGWEYRGRRVTRGPVVYCAFEGADGYNARAEAFRIRFLTADQGLVPFYLVAAKMDFLADHQALIASIKAQIGPTSPVAVGLDTLNRSIGGKEDDERMAGYIGASDAIREEFHCVVPVVHHCGVEGTRPRGHTSLTGAAEAQIEVKRDEAKNIVVRVEYMKDGPEGTEIFSRLEPVEVGRDQDGDLITSCVIVPVDGADISKPQAKKPKQMPKTAQTALRALKQAIDECGEDAPTSNHIPASVRVTSISRWREYSYRLGISAGEDRAKQKAFKTASEYLVGSADVASWDDYVWPTR
jgi:AAA domain-containing protein